ncbi:GNAT family N-acetyltransferase [uncultured Pseudokineococcus sp.]|uniref:GNAT family N-acetyltransferase n=1 Tax=uncultured Pseudokineococcus sp. TaxID=1642928 RepID=UPI00263787C8|nr:GNAT family N-acetyltransferase [uncultured Pseudokineococcus sp.]
MPVPDRAGSPGSLDGPLHDATTARLGLRAPVAEDAGVLHERVMTDPRTWELDAALRPGAAVEVAEQLRTQVERWRRHGLGSWVVRELAGPGAGAPVGIGGCSLPTDRAWNLAFRLRPAVWGRGYGVELAVAALTAAHRVRPDLPVTAVAVEANAPSRRVLERSGLVEVARAPDPRGLSPSPVCLHADRPLPQELVQALLAWRPRRPPVVPDGAAPGAG